MNASTLLQNVQRIRQHADCLYTQAEVDQALDRMAAAITSDLSDKNPLCIGVLQGGLLPLGFLVQRLDFPLTVDYVHASRYRENLTGDKLVWQGTPAGTLAGRHVLIVDDILDEGHTLAALLAYCATQQPASVRTAVLVHKQHDRGVQPQLDYCGLKVPARYVFGCGMDYKGYWRNQSGIYAVADASTSSATDG